MLDGLRRRNFPKARNVVPAHVSLFHALPGLEIASIRTTLADVCQGCAPFELTPDVPVFLGRGVALRFRARKLDDFRAELGRRWADWLSPQDRQGFRAHVTLQNKVDPAVARDLFERMTTFDAPTCRVEGVSLWHYRGGPWEPAAVFRFGATE